MKYEKIYFVRAIGRNRNNWHFELNFTAFPVNCQGKIQDGSLCGQLKTEYDFHLHVN